MRLVVEVLMTVVVARVVVVGSNGCISSLMFTPVEGL